MKDFIKIDGMRGEGGGQILRTSLALSIITGQAFKMTNIRSRRKRPGLMRQHLTAVRAAAEICGAQVSGDEINSTSLEFIPGKLKSGEFHFKVGSAGSAMLVLQTVLPPLLTGEAKTVLAVEGGTHNMMAPPYDFLDKTFLQVLRNSGVNVSSELIRWGFYPAGGGKVTFEVEPVKKLKPFKLEHRGELKKRFCRTVLSAVPEYVGQRELDRAKKKLSWKESEFCLEEIERPLGPGNVMLFELEYENVNLVFTAFGEKGIAAEKVADGGVARVRNYLTSEAVADEYLADQLLIPMALAQGGSFTATMLSSHTTTNMDIIKMFIDVDFEVEELGTNCIRVNIK